VTIRISSAAQLAQAIAAAKGGERFALAPGDYGPLVIARKWTRRITIVGARILRSSFASIDLSGAAGVEIIGCRVAGLVKATGAERLRLERLNVKTGGKFGCLLNTVRDFTLLGCTLGGATEDLLRITGDSYRGRIENNNLLDVAATGTTHPDMIQIFGSPGKTPHDLVIRGNHIWDDPATGPSRMPQGIFLSDSRSEGGFRNILIENNLICVRSPNSIYIDGGQENVVVRGNRLMPSIGRGGAIIRLAAKSRKDNSGTTVEGNTAKGLRDETRKSTVRDNVIYGAAPLSEWFSGDGSKREHFWPAGRV
jgi:hypothetical protein